MDYIDLNPAHAAKSKVLALMTNYFALLNLDNGGGDVTHGWDNTIATTKCDRPILSFAENRVIQFICLPISCDYAGDLFKELMPQLLVVARGITIKDRGFLFSEPAKAASLQIVDRLRRIRPEYYSMSWR